MAVSMSAALATPWFLASTAPLTSMATVRVTTRPGASSTTYTASPAACSSPVASATASAGAPSDAALPGPDLHSRTAEKDPERRPAVLGDPQWCRTGRGGVGLRRLRVVAVAKPAAAGLAAQPAGLHQGPLQ